MTKSGLDGYIFPHRFYACPTRSWSATTAYGAYGAHAGGNHAGSQRHAASSGHSLPARVCQAQKRQSDSAIAAVQFGGHVPPLPPCVVAEGPDMRAGNGEFFFLTDLCACKKYVWSVGRPRVERRCSAMRQPTASRRMLPTSVAQHLMKFRCVSCHTTRRGQWQLEE